MTRTRCPDSLCTRWRTTAQETGGNGGLISWKWNNCDAITCLWVKSTNEEVSVPTRALGGLTSHVRAVSQQTEDRTLKEHARGHRLIQRVTPFKASNRQTALVPVYYTRLFRAGKKNGRKVVQLKITFGLMQYVFQGVPVHRCKIWEREWKFTQASAAFDFSQPADHCGRKNCVSNLTFFFLLLLSVFGNTNSG